MLDLGVRLTTAEERTRIRAIAERRTDHLSDADLDVLGYDRWLAGLEAGVAAHHAGMVPPFKEAVEACFVDGLVKVVFATETLALGINMPARSVVIETLSKFTGERHEDLSPSQYTQLTGRAGRRGLDPVGHAIALWSPWYGFDRVAALASSRDFVLRSAFAPTYNMAANLVRRYDRADAHRLLDRSFAQFQADRANTRVVARRERLAASLTDAEAAARCDLGDVDEYRALLREDRAEAEAARPPRQDVEDAMSRLAPGDVIRDGGDRLAVLTVAFRKGAPRLRVVDTSGNVRTVDPDDLDQPPERAAALSLPEPFNPHNHAFVHQTVNLLRKARLRQPRGPSEDRWEPTFLDASAPHHPVATCPDRDQHLLAARDADRLRRELAELDARIQRNADRLGRRFDAIVDLLSDWGYLDGWSLTDRGEVLVRLYHESDLLVAEAVCAGHLDDLDPPSLAAVASTLTYEHRSKEAPPAPWYPSKQVRASAIAIEQIARQLQGDEARAGLPATRLPDPTFLAIAQAWAAGEDLDVVLDDEDLSGGDFVRNMKQLIDLLRQIADVAPRPATRHAAGAAADGLLRGIVSAASAVGEGVDDDEPWDDAAAEGAAP